MDESGVDAGARNIGRTALFAIPLLLAMAASVWLAFYVGVRQEQQAQRQRERSAGVVGAEVAPTGKIELTVERRLPCANLSRADMDAGTLRLYVTNDCHREMRYLEWHWEALSPNGTVLYSRYTNTGNCPVPTRHGESAECVLAAGGYAGVPADGRISKVRVYTSDATFR